MLTRRYERRTNSVIIPQDAIYPFFRAASEKGTTISFSIVNILKLKCLEYASNNSNRVAASLNINFCVHVVEEHSCVKLLKASFYEC